MTDLERAQSELLDTVACAYQGMWTQPLIARVTEILAAARREGAEAERAANAEAKDVLVHIAMAQGAEEMRERAAQRVEEMRERAAELAEAHWGAGGPFIADDIRALPLTPEEPT